MGKLKHLDDDDVELFGVKFRNKGEDLRAQAFILKIVFIFNVIIMPFNVFDNIDWINFILNHSYIFNIIIISSGEVFYYLYVKFISKKIRDEHPPYKHEKKEDSF